MTDSTAAPPASKSEPQRVLIVAPAWVGDMVMAHTLVQVLHARHANVNVHMLAPPATAPLATRMPGVHGHTVFSLAHGELGWQKRRAYGKALAREGFDTAFVLPNSLKSALVPWFADIPRRVGWHGESRYLLLNDRRQLIKEQLPLMIERFMALANPPGSEVSGLPEPYPQPVLTTNAARASLLRTELGLSAGAVTVLCPGAEFGPAKKWPAEHYAAVARHELEREHQVWLIGSPKDEADAAKIARAAPGAINLAGKTSLIDAVDLMSLAGRVVTNDSGLMHVACAVGVPTVAVYGSTSPDFTPPLGNNTEVVRLGLDCSPCFQRECPLGHLNCLRELSPELVLKHL